MDYNDLGRRVRKQRAAMGLTQEALAKKIGVSTSFVGHVERGSRKASLETLVALANTLCVSIDYLLAGSLTFANVIGKNANLTKNQRMAMQEILTTIQSHIQSWVDADEDE